ncbi:hypothetical protein MMPV_002561 [Pyropia vietnamensis]
MAEAAEVVVAAVVAAIAEVAAVAGRTRDRRPGESAKIAVWAAHGVRVGFIDQGAGRRGVSHIGHDREDSGYGA